MSGCLGSVASPLQEIRAAGVDLGRSVVVDQAKRLVVAAEASQVFEQQRDVVRPDARRPLEGRDRSVDVAKAEEDPRARRPERTRALLGRGERPGEPESDRGVPAALREERPRERAVTLRHGRERPP